MSKLNTPIVIAHPKTGKLITMTTSRNGKKYGKVRVDQMELIVNGSFSTSKRRSAFITLDEETVSLVEPLLQDRQPYPVEGKIIVRESIIPFYEGQEPKYKGKGGDVVLYKEHPVYRETEFTTDMNAQDRYYYLEGAPVEQH